MISKIILSLAVLVSHLLLFPNTAIPSWIILSILIVVALSVRVWQVVLVPILLLLMATTSLYFPQQIARLPSLPFLIPFLVTTLIAAPFAIMRENLNWFKKGQLDRNTWILIAVTGVMATGALIAWGFWSDTLALALIFARIMHNYSAWLMLGLMIPAFALINAFAEEVVYRGVLQEAFTRTFGEKHWTTFLLPSAAFAAAHVAGGFPNGKVGYVMVLFYGLMLGYLRQRSKGMLAPYLAHILADLTIGYFLYFKAMQ